MRENNEMIKLFYMEVCVFNKSMFSTLLSNKIISTPINIYCQEDHIEKKINSFNGEQK
jgi:hypothetical protein